VERGYQKWLVFLTALAVVVDGIDNQLLGIVIPTVIREWGVPRSAFAPIVSAGYLGMMIGGAIAGLTGDRYGRRASLVASVFLFGMMTVAAAVAAGLLGLAVLRFLAGHHDLARCVARALLTLLTLTSATINGVQTTMDALAAHVYPSAIRATGVGTAVSFGRTGRF
jgi:MFS family permease